MARTRIKICGVTRPEDAAEAARLGADAIGMMLTPGQRRTVTDDAARQIMNVLPAFVTPVGLFANVKPAQVLQTAKVLGIRHVQLHGQETPQDVEALRSLRIIKAITAQTDALSAELASWAAAIADAKLSHIAAILIDSPGGGGSGVENDWEAIGRILRDGGANGLPPIVVAGGLTPTNVTNVIRGLRPWAVDVCSGVEESLRIKSPAALAAFMAAVAAADE